MSVVNDWGMSTFDLVNQLYQLGHFWSPEALAVELVHEKDLPRLTLTDKVVEAAVLSYQRYFQDDLSQFTMRGVKSGGHERPAIPDGEVGEGTMEILNMNRCGMPDFVNPEAGVLEANWPTNCRMNLTTSYNMNLNGLTAEELRQLWVDSEWERVIAVKLHHQQDKYPNTNIFAFRANLGNNVLADQYLATGNCNYRSQGRFANITWTPNYAKTVKEHEHGHAFGVPHIRDPNATMFPSIHQASLARGGALTESDISAALALGYQRATDQPPRPPTPPTTEWQRTILLRGKGNVSDVTATVS